MIFDPEIILSGISLFGMAAVSRHESRFWGFFICLIGNVGWLVIGFLSGHTTYLILFGGYFIFNAIGMHDEYAIMKHIHAIKSKI